MKCCKACLKPLHLPKNQPKQADGSDEDLCKECQFQAKDIYKYTEDHVFILDN